MADFIYNITDSAQSHYIYGEVNAPIIYELLNEQGYSDESIIGIIANMEHESYINPGQGEIGRGLSGDYGLGLVQWTPGQKLLDAAAPFAEKGYFWFTGGLQIAYLLLTIEDSWIKTTKYPISVEQFKKLDDYKYATEVFFYNFERGTWTDDLYTYAEYWAKELKILDSSILPILFLSKILK